MNPPMPAVLPRPCLGCSPSCCAVCSEPPTLSACSLCHPAVPQPLSTWGQPSAPTTIPGYLRVRRVGSPSPAGKSRAVFGDQSLWGQAQVGQICPWGTAHPSCCIPTALPVCSCPGSARFLPPQPPPHCAAAAPAAPQQPHRPQIPLLCLPHGLLWLQPPQASSLCCPRAVPALPLTLLERCAHLCVCRCARTASLGHHGTPCQCHSLPKG